MAHPQVLTSSNGAPKSKEEIAHENEAVCFTAGLEGAPFGAGVIHAYLAAARKAPRIVAGISVGALTSAAFQRAYKELKGSSEDARWQWYRRYLRAISERPFDVIWSGIPDQSDFFAEFNPVRDPVPETIADPYLKVDLVKAELDARSDLTLFVKLGHWISRLPIKVGTLGDVAVRFVRIKERYGHSLVWRYLTFWFSLLSVVFRPLIHNAFHPQFIRQTAFGKEYKRPGGAFLFMVLSFVPAWVILGLFLEGRFHDHPAAVLGCLAVAALLGTFGYGYLANKNPRPLFGWPLYGAAVTFCLSLLMAGVWALVGASSVAAKNLSKIQPSASHPYLTKYLFQMGWGLQKLNEILFPGAEKGMKLLFLIAFVATSIGAMRLISKGRRNSDRRKHRSWLKAVASLWALKLVRIISYSIGGLILICSVLAATVGPVRAFFAGLASAGWMHRAIEATNRVNQQLSWVAGKAIEWRYWIIAACALACAIFIVRTGQRLSRSELDSIASAKLRRRAKFFAWSLPCKLAFVAWAWCLIILSTADIALAIQASGWQRALCLAAVVLPLVLLAQVVWQSNGPRWKLKSRKWIGFLVNLLFENLNLHKSLVHNYYLRLALYDLFREEAPERKPDQQPCNDAPRGQQGENRELARDREPILYDEPFPAVLVAAPLQVTPAKEHDLDSYQVWAANGSSLIDALTAALAFPGLYEPAHVYPLGETDRAGQTSSHKKKGLDAWRLPEGSRNLVKNNLGELDVVDGTVIRQNPIPAFFNFIAEDSELTDSALANSKRPDPELANDSKPFDFTPAKDPQPPQSREFAKWLSTKKDDPRVHIVYSVPIDPEERKEKDVNASIVDVGLAAAKLSRRRDTQLEVHQSNLLSQVESQLRALGTKSSRINPIFVDEIAPKCDAQYKNPWSPTRDEVVDRVAAGCRATLEVIYAKDLARLANTRHKELIPCADLMKEVSDRKESQSKVPGLSEICAVCERSRGRLLKPPPPKSQGKPDSKPVHTWASFGGDTRDLPQLKGDLPRIAFVASGGVFRGTFHAGMVAALLAARIKPDLIVGASVGTIMGGALAAAFCASSYEDAIDHLEMLTSVLLSVDTQIAFTKAFKNAVRDLGIRVRDITISPNDVRKMVLDGSSNDAAFGVVGAPSVLIDNISHLLLIPHKKTANIAAEFIAGHVTLATKRLLDQLEKETLKRLNIEYAVIGTSLMQPTAERLLTADGANLKTVQPFRQRDIALYGTTIDFWRQRPVLLGAERADRGPLYNFIEAALCSSAFPCVFSTRRESDLYPGTGDPATIFSDGGMFDNLPFLPAAEILSKVQANAIQSEEIDSAKPKHAVSMEALRKRRERPDLFIAGSLNVNLQDQQDIGNSFQNIVEITRRASALQNNVKIKGYEQVLITLDEQLGKLLEAYDKKPTGKGLDLDLLDGIVNAAVLPVYPVDPEHLNGTFAFCASTGMKQERLKDSIADGCFQTLRKFAEPTGSTGPTESLNRSIAGLKECNKLPEVSWMTAAESARKRPSAIKNAGDGTQPTPREFHPRMDLVDRPLPGECKFFKLSPASSSNWFKPGESKLSRRFVCPFYQAAEQLRKKKTQDKEETHANKKRARQMREIYDRCITDEVHIRFRGHV